MIRPRPIKLILGAVVLVVVVAGVGIWWFFIRDNAPAEFSARSQISGDCSAGARPANFDGVWTIAASCDSEAGFRITESIASLTDHTAVGRSAGVTGALTVAGTTVTKGSFTVDLTALAFADDPGLPVANRSRALQDRGLETNRFPTATFALTKPIDLGALPAEGKTVTISVPGVLTLHGTDQAVTLSVDVTAQGSVVRLVTHDVVPVVLADYGITKPTGGPAHVAAIADQGSFEFQVFLAKQG